MTLFRTPADVREEFQAHPRRALILTTVIYESNAVGAHLTGAEILIGANEQPYEYGRFVDPAGDWMIVHVLTPQGNVDTSLVASAAYQAFGGFHVQMFVGVAGSLKDDIAIGSVVIGDYVYNGHSGKAEDDETFSRPHGLAPMPELLRAAQTLIYTDEWKALIRDPKDRKLPPTTDYPCNFPPIAVIKGIVSGEEVVSGGKSHRFIWLRRHFNDCGAVEMEGWGAMKAAQYQIPRALLSAVSRICAQAKIT